jgi:hypothetical protein
MSVASELHLTLRSMGFMQLLIAIVFLAGYSVACSTLFGSRGRTRAAGVALIAAVAFTALTQPWVHGALMVAGAVAGLGLFSAIGWILSAALHHPQAGAAVADELAPEEALQPEPVAAPTASPRAPQHTRIPAA